MRLVVCAPGISICREKRQQDRAEREIKLWCIETEASVEPREALGLEWPFRLDKNWGEEARTSLPFSIIEQSSPAGFPGGGQ